MPSTNLSQSTALPLSRRRLLAAGPAAAALAALPRLAAAQATPTAGGWTFTDDAGKTVTLPTMPTRVAGDLNAMSSLWDFGVKPVGVSGWTTSTDVAWGNLPRDTPVISSAAGAPDPDPEKLLQLGADLFVTIYWGHKDNPYEWSFPDPETAAKINQIVPVIGINGTGNANANIERFAELAALLGADVNAPAVQEAKAAYDKAIADLKANAAAKKDLKSIFVYADGTSMYVAYPPIWADLSMYQELGLNTVVPDGVPAGDYWEELSPEQALKYPADILFQSARDGAFTIEQLKAHPTYGQIPAVKEGQAYSWNQDSVQSYEGMKAAVQAVADALKDAKDITP